MAGAIKLMAATHITALAASTPASTALHTWPGNVDPVIQRPP
jgi:hypothetical protein